MRGPWGEAGQLQRPLPDAILKIVASGEREDHLGSRRRVAALGDKPKLLGILHFAQRNHHGVSFYRVVLGEKKVHAIGQHVDDARAAPLAAAKNIPKLIAFDFLHGILRRPLSSDAGSRRRALRRWVQIALNPASKILGLQGVFIRSKGLEYVIADSAFKRMQVDARARWLDTGEHHRGLALRTSGALKCNRWNGGRQALRSGHDASLE
jgi:hypothetical protein